MHVVDHTIKPIRLYDCKVWGMFNPFISKLRNTLLNISRIFDKLPADKLHQISVNIYLGFTQKQAMQLCCQNWVDFPVVHDASDESKILSHSNKPSWYASINYIFKIIKTYKSGNNDNVNTGGKLVQHYFLHEWKHNLQAQANGKLCSFVLFKSSFGCEKIFVCNK
jgi:hypothetical protein